MNLEPTKNRLASWLYRSRLGIKLNVLVVLILVPSFVFTIIFVATNLQLQENTSRTTKYLQTVLDLGNLKSSLLNIETGLRGFILSGNKKFLEPYKIGLEDSQILLGKLKQAQEFPVAIQALDTEIRSYQLWVENQLKNQDELSIVLQADKTRFDRIRLAFTNLDKDTKAAFEFAEKEKNASLKVMIEMSG